jgi:hypothetical protein
MGLEVRFDARSVLDTPRDFGHVPTFDGRLHGAIHATSGPVVRRVVELVHARLDCRSGVRIAHGFPQ